MWGWKSHSHSSVTHMTQEEFLLAATPCGCCLLPSCLGRSSSSHSSSCLCLSALTCCWCWKSCCCCTCQRVVGPRSHSRPEEWSTKPLGSSFESTKNWVPLDVRLLLLRHRCCCWCVACCRSIIFLKLLLLNQQQQYSGQSCQKRWGVNVGIIRAEFHHNRGETKQKTLYNLELS